MVLVGSGASGSVANAQDAGSVFWVAFAKDATSRRRDHPDADVAGHRREHVDVGDAGFEPRSRRDVEGPHCR